MNKLAHKVMVSVFRYAVPALLVLLSLGLLTTPAPYLAPLPAFGLLILLWLGKRALFPWLFYGIIFLIPFGAYRGLGGDLGFLRIHWLLAVGLLAFILARMLLQRRIPPELNQRTFWGLVVVFYLINIFATMGSRVPMVSGVFMLLLAAGYLLVALGIIVITRQGYTRTLPRVIVNSIFIGSMLGILGTVFKIGLFIDPVSGRATGASPDPNNMSLMIIFSLPLVIYLLLSSRRAAAKLWYLMVFAVNIIGVISTFSRGGALVLCIALVLMLWEFRSKLTPRNLGFLLGLGGLALMLFLILSPEAYTQRIKSIKVADDTPMRRRASYLVVAKDLVADRPLLGSGPDSFASLYADSELGKRYKKGGTDGKREAHNTYAEVLVGSGIIGFIFFAMILGYSLRSFTRAQKRFLQQGLPRMALLTAAYRTSYLTLLVYLMMYSEVMHKHLLVSLALSQVALRLAESASLGKEVEDA